MALKTDERPLADSVWLSESGVVIGMLEAALLIDQEPSYAEDVRRSALVDVRNHYSDDLGQLSVFASLSFDAYGHLRLGGVDEGHESVRVELRDPGSEPLFAWEVPVEFFVDEDMRRTSSAHRVSMMMRAVENALERSEVKTASSAGQAEAETGRPAVRRLFNPRKTEVL